MKKYVLFFLGLFFCMAVNVKAVSLNFRTNFLYSYTYVLNGEEKNFYLYNSNINDEAIYSLTPNEPPSYSLDYQYSKWSKDEDKWKTIQELMAASKEANMWENELYYRIITQMRIWKTVNPNLNIEYKTGKSHIFERIPEFDNILKKYFKPDWIDNYKITQELILEGNFENYKIESKSCTIHKKDTMLEISNCKEGDNKIIVKSNSEVKKQVQVYQSEQQTILENGDWFREYTMNIKKEKEEIIHPVIPPAPDPVIPEKPESPEIIVKPENTKTEENHTLTNVPKTSEMKIQDFDILVYGGGLCILFAKYYSHH